MKDEPLTLIRGIRFSPKQWARIKEHALHCDLKPTTYVRQTALGVVPRQRRRAYESDIVYHLGRLGNNLNQLARRHNSGEPVARAEVLAAVEKIRAVLRRL
jgi:hypothetical protein